VINGTYSADYNIATIFNNQYKKSSLAQLLPIIPTFKNSIGTIQSNVDSWSNVIDSIMDISWSVETAILTIQSKIDELQAEIA